MDRTCSKLFAASALCLGMSMGAPALGQGALQRADTEYDAGHYAVALAEYEHLAAQGSASAAERAGAMLYYGESRFGTSVRRDASRARGYLSQAAEAGRPAARILLERFDAAPESRDPTSEPSVFGPYGC